jgi:class 3 adenylate cyclase
VLQDDKISRRHALIQAQAGDAYWLSDLGSSNGTYLNSLRLGKSARLYDKDQIALGPHRLTFRQPSGPQRPPGDQTLADATLCDSKNEYAWLLLVHLESPTRIAESLAPARIPVVLGRWQEQCTELVQCHGGTLNKYLTDGFLAFWRDGRATRAGVTSAVEELRRLQSHSEPPFRLILHYGQIRIERPGAADEEQVSGAALNFILRAQKLHGAKGASLVSEVAGALLREQLQISKGTKIELETLAGEKSFYQL